MSKLLTKNKLCILLHQIGPYHHARFQAIAELFDLTVIEIRSSSTEYFWKSLNHDITNYKNLKISNPTELLKLLKKTVFDSFLTYGWNEKEYLITILFAKSKKISVFVASDSIEISNKSNIIKHFIKRTIAHSVDGFLVAGTKSEEYIRWYVPHAIIEKPFDVVDNEHFKYKKESESEKKYLLCVTRLIEKKNIQSLIFAIAEIEELVKKHNIVLRIVGSGIQQEILEKLIISLNLSGIVTLEPWKTYDELPPVYHQAKALILPSLYDETWGLVVNEAMAAGLPVLVSNVSGCAPDLVKNGENGYLFAPEISEIKNAIVRLLNNTPEQCKIMGEKSKEIVANYSLTNHCNALVSLTNMERKPFTTIQKIVLQLISRIK